ncbi:MAG TPA: TonB-dependent receptor [Candidatus Acidoferrales bacterium]|nr:TonB-dependent receptor [Candidatus Acidoferrales bacterium]
MTKSNKVFSLLVVLAGLALSLSAWGQATTSLGGVVTDPSGGAVPGAKVTLVNAATNESRQTVTTATGVYTLVSVPPGTYKLTIEATGFRTYTRTGLQLLVNLPVTVNVSLEVGAVTQTVQVTGQVALVNTTDASLGNTIEQGQIAQLPIADRNVVQLLSLQPGVAYLGSKLDTSVTDTRSGAVNGLRSDQSNVTLDGIGVNDQNNGYAFTSVLTVPPDSVQEFRVTTADPNADSGYSSGAQVALVTKSGTNQFHGSVYEYNRNTIFSANDTFLKADQQAGGAPNQRPELLRNVFGASFGGPIFHNRLFFFTNYEGRRDAEGQSVLRTVPSATLRDSIIEYNCADPGSCPGGSVTGASGKTYAVAPGNYALGPSQLAGIDPLGIGPNQAVAKLLQQYPLPNEMSQGDALNMEGYRFASKSAPTFNTYIARLDYHFTSNGSETLFWRGETQNNKQPQAQQFPGQGAARTLLDDSKGSFVGLTSVLSPALVNDFHWGYIRQGGQVAGASLQPEAILDGLDSIVPFTRSTIAIVPVNQFSDGLTWARGSHALQFGTDVFLIRSNRVSFANSFSDAQTNVAYLNTAAIANTPSPLDPANNGFPAVLGSFGTSYDNATTVLLGILTQGDGVYNFTRTGTPLPQGAPNRRRYAINDYEFFGQDSWRMTPRLTLTYGLRWVLEAPPYETNGLQVAPCIASSTGGCTNQTAADWFNKTAALAAQGQPANAAGEISFILGGPANNGPDFWNWDYHDFSPRIAVAWAPDPGNGWLSKIFGRKDRFSIRGGYSIMYDHFGIPIVNSFDQHGSFGLSSDIGNPAGVVTPADAPRFTCLTCLPPPCPSLNGPGCLYGPAPVGGFPVTPSNSAFAINWGLDQSLKTPYAHVFNFSITRQLTSISSLQIAYVGSIGRRLSLQVDLGMPANLTDPSSHMTYFQAATLLSKLAAKKTPTSQINPIPFFENIFPQWSTVTQSDLNSQSLNCAPDNFPGAMTATQAIYGLWSCFLHNETFSLFLMDTPGNVSGVDIPHSKFGPYTFFHDQFSSYTAWRNIGTSDYHALQVTYSIRWGANLLGQFNYTFSKSLDEASDAGRVGPWQGTGGTGNDLNGGGIVINSWDPLSLRGLSDFNTFHQFNANWVYHLPFGKGQMLAGNAGRLLNGVIGGWRFSGIYRWTTGFPTTVDNGFAWATNWNIEGDAMPNGPLPVTSNPSNAFVNGKPIGPDIFANPAAAEAAFRQDWPGESGTRNNIIGDGVFNIDTGLNKDFSLGESRRLEFSWQVFNVTNSVRYNVRGAQPSLSFAPSVFGKYNSTLTTPRFMQFALRLAF